MTLSRRKKLALAALCVLAVGASMLFRRSPAPFARAEGDARKLITRKLSDPRGAGEHVQLLHSFEERIPRVPTAATTADPDTRSREFAAHPSRSFHPGGAMLEPADNLPLAQPHDELLADASSQAVAAAPPRTHRVVDGDTLAKLAARYLGSSDRYGEIFAANRSLLSTPDLLPIGVQLVIPPRQRPAPPVALGPEDAPDASRVDDGRMPRLDVLAPPARTADPLPAGQPDLTFPSDDDTELVPVQKEVPRQQE